MKRTGRSSVRKSESKKAARLPYKNPGLPSAKRVKDLLVPHDPGRESSADALHLDAEGPNAGGCRRQFRPSESPDGLQERARTWPGGPPQRCRKGQRRARHGGTHQCHSEVLHRDEPPGNSRDFSRRVFARTRGPWGHQLSAAHRPGRHVRSRFGRDHSSR